MSNPTRPAEQNLVISSLTNPRVKQVVELRERRERDRTGLTRVEGYEELGFAIESGIRPAALYYCPGMFRDAAEIDLLEKIRATGSEMIEVTERVFEKMAYREGADGWLATVRTPGKHLQDVRVSDPAFVVVADAVDKPGNLGAILRTAEAAGVNALISADPVTDWGNPNVVRASKGTVFNQVVAQAPSDETIAWLHERGIRIVVATPQATVNYTDVDYRAPVAIVVGSEKFGASPLWLERANPAVRIPMLGRVNSLNVSIAAALLIYEVVRQRQAGLAR